MSHAYVDNWRIIHHLLLVVVMVVCHMTVGEQHAEAGYVRRDFSAAAVETPPPSPPCWLIPLTAVAADWDFLQLWEARD